MTPQKPTFQEVKNNFLHLLIFVFIGLLFGCDKKKEEKENIVSTQGDSTLNTEKKYYSYIDSTIAYLNKNNYISDTIWENNCEKIAIKEYFNQSLTIAFLQPNIGLGHLETNNTTPAMLYILQREKQNWQVVYDGLPIDDNDYSCYLDTIVDIDFNFDEQLDIYVKYNVKYISREISAFYLLTFDKEQKSIKYKDFIYSIDSIAILPETKSIIAWTDGGIFGTHAQSTYRWNSDTLQEIRKLEKTIVTNKDGGILGYKMVEYVLQNNKLVKKREWLDKNETDYFEKWQ